MGDGEERREMRDAKDGRKGMETAGLKEKKANNNPKRTLYICLINKILYNFIYARTVRFVSVLKSVFNIERF